MLNWKHVVKRSIVQLGTRTPIATTGTLRRMCDLIDCGRWLREHSLYPFKWSFSEREQIYDLIAREVGNEPALYLEFGVFEGYSMRYWSRLLANPRSVLHGFDSFEGLPETWKDDHPKGRFATYGQLPDIPDERIKFFKGWFNETLPSYTMPPHDKVILNIDCDLYSSTKYVLDRLKDSIRVGTWLYLDEFGSWDHEGRAFRELVEQTHMEFEPVAECGAVWSAAFRRIK